VFTVVDAQPVTLATVDSQLDSTSQHEEEQDRGGSTDAAADAAGVSVATAMASVAMTVGFIYRSAVDASSTTTTDLQYCNIADDGSYFRPHRRHCC